MTLLTEFDLDVKIHPPVVVGKEKPQEDIDNPTSDEDTCDDGGGGTDTCAECEATVGCEPVSAVCPTHAPTCRECKA